MRPRISHLLGVGLALTWSCAGPQATRQPARLDTVVLEIITNAQGAVYPKEGDILEMRLYESGRFEYDAYPEQGPPRVVAGHVVITRGEARLSEAEVRELVGLAEQPDFLAADESYPGFRPHIDDRWMTTIRFTHQGRSKTISAVNFWDMLHHPEDRSRYPASVVRLLERARDMRANALRSN